MEICKICHKEFKSKKSLSIHISCKHKPAEKYYLDFGGTRGECKTCHGPTGFINVFDGYKDFCCSACVSKNKDIQKKKEGTFLDHYGVTNCFSSDSMKLQIEDTNLKKYGSKHPSHYDKVEKTMLKKYGVENASQSEEFKEKRKDTINELYGVDYAMQCPEIQARQRQSLLSRYGVEVPYKSKDIRKHGIDTCRKNYDVDNPSQSDEVKQKKIESCQQHFGVDFPMESEEVRNKSIATCNEKYGVDHWTQAEEARLVFRNLKLDMIEEMYGFSHMCGRKESKFLTSLSKVIPYRIEDQKRMCGYCMDIYLPHIKLDIEFDEYSHEYSKHKDYDIIREKNLKLKESIDTIRIKESNWLQDPNLEILKICWRINGITNK